MKAVSGKELCRILERLGWVRVKTKGGHRKYVKPGYSPVVIPVHGNKSLKSGTQHKIMRDAGLTEADL